MIPNRSSGPISRLAVAIAVVVALAGCSGGGGSSTQLSDGDVRSDEGAGAPSETEQPPELLAEKEVTSECANALGTGDPAFEAAFCAYSEAARTATSGPDGVAGIDPTLLMAADDALALFPDDPAAALALLQSATERLGG